MSFPEPTSWNGGPDREEDLRHSDPDDCEGGCYFTDSCDVYDAAVERELIREVNERNAELQDKRWLDLFISFGLLVLGMLFLLTPKAMRWLYFLWK